MQRKIPATMASQHPDHARKPYWHDRAFIDVQHEYKECYLSYTDLGIDEYKWDWEGKLVDESFMERFLAEYYTYFKKHPLGLEKFLTFRLPNPKVETEFRIGRAFMGIISAASLAKQVGLYSPPLFEVILPMTESAEEMIALQDAFLEMNSLKHSLYRFTQNALKNIEIIPLFEQVSTIARSDTILKEYLALYRKRFGNLPLYLRPYVARSDPALNSGLVPTVLAIKIALSRYQKFTKKTGVALYPIIGSASLPFRGGLTPHTVEQFTKEYKGIKTVLLQSAFRYDYEKHHVIDAVKQLSKILPKNFPEQISLPDEQDLQELITYFETFYRSTIEEIAPIINSIAQALPKRRERVQHIGLFGYSREVGKVKLPRAIGFTGALYSLGVPPEFIGTGRGIKKALSRNKQDILGKYYHNLREDLERAGRFLNKSILTNLAKKSSAWRDVMKDVQAIEKYLGIAFSPITSDEKEYARITTRIYDASEKGEIPNELLTPAALLRKSLG